MESALAWIGKIADWIGQWFPRWQILNTTEGAIKYRTFLLPLAFRRFVGRSYHFNGDIRVKVCGPGLHWYWPANSTFIGYPIAQQTDRLEAQTMESSDGKTFIVCGTITYSVTDLSLLLPLLHSPTKSTIDITMTVLHDVCCDMTWAALQDESRRGTLKTKLKNSAQRQLEQYGLKVIMVKVTSLARCRVLKVSQSVSTEEN